MKMISIVCNISVVQIIVELLEELDVNNYQIIDEVHTRTVVGNPRLNTSIWPGYSSIISFQHADNEQLNSILNQLKEYNASAENKTEYITVSSWKLDDYFYS
jgi:hypothetical protein